MILVGASLGGVRALSTILAGLDKTWTEPIALVVHRAKDSEDLLTGVLQTRTPLAVTEVVDKDPILPGKLYVAPPDYHLLVDEDCFSLSVDAPVNFARPSIDVLFESAAFALGARATAIVLTGSSADGAAGAAAIAARGGRVIVQAPETAESPILPRAVIRKVPAAHVLRLEEIALFLQQSADPHI
jgi:two-component system chemotaxis response regulator CheB